MVSASGRGELNSVMWGLALYSLLYGVISVSDDLFAETLSLFVVSQISKVWIYSCRCVAVVS